MLPIVSKTHLISRIVTVEYYFSYLAMFSFSPTPWEFEDDLPRFDSFDESTFPYDGKYFFLPIESLVLVLGFPVSVLGTC